MALLGALLQNQLPAQYLLGGGTVLSGLGYSRHKAYRRIEYVAFLEVAHPSSRIALEYWVYWEKGKKNSSW